MEQRNCTSCKGAGKRETIYLALTGATIPERPCHSCDGSGTFVAVDVPAILEAIKGRKGLRTKPPDCYGTSRTTANTRAYYVWRLARFHGGVDVTMPVMASTLIAGDPFLAELDALADAVARRVYGTDRAAAFRWANALGGSVAVPDGLPPTAYACGPVLMAEKPEEEMGELRF